MTTTMTSGGQATGSEGGGSSDDGGNNDNNAGAGGGGGQAQGGSQSAGGGSDWKSALPEDIRNAGALAPINDIESLAKSYIHAQSMVGKKGHVLPNDKSSDEEWGRFFEALGVPKPEGYEVEAPKELGFSEDQAKAFKEVAAKAGVLPKQAKQLLDWMSSYQSETATSIVEQQNQRQKEGVEALQRKWGEAYDDKIRSAQHALKTLGGEGLADMLNETKLGNEPVIIEFFERVGALLGEPNALHGSDGGRMTMTPTEIQDKINQINSDKSHPYWDRSHQGHKNAVNEMARLYQKLDATKQRAG